MIWAMRSGELLQTVRADFQARRPGDLAVVHHDLAGLRTQSRHCSTIFSDSLISLTRMM